MSDFNLLVNSSKEINGIKVSINLSKKTNILSKSVLSLIGQTNNKILENLDQVFLSGSDTNNKVKGFLVERIYENKDFQGSSYFTIIDNDLFKNDSISYEFIDNDSFSKEKNIKNLSSITNSSKSTTVNYDINYFEIPSEIVVKNKVLLTDYLMRQYYYNQGVNYSLSKMEEIVETIYKNKEFDNNLEIDFYRAITKASSSSNEILFTQNKSLFNIESSFRTLFSNKKLLFEYAINNLNDFSLDVVYKKIYQVDIQTGRKLLITEKKYNKNSIKLHKIKNKFYGSIFDKAKADSLISNTKIRYEIELKFDIYDIEKSNKITSETKFIRL